MRTEFLGVCHAYMAIPQTNGATQVISWQLDQQTVGNRLIWVVETDDNLHFKIICLAVQFIILSHNLPVKGRTKDTFF